jgi:hypothetical protein
MFNSSFPFLFSLLLLTSAGCSGQGVDTSSATKKSVPLWGDAPFRRPSCIKGIHLTSWYAGNKKARAKIDNLLAETELNTVVIGVKEIEGDVFLPGLKIEFSTNTQRLSPILKGAGHIYDCTNCGVQRLPVASGKTRMGHPFFHPFAEGCSETLSAGHLGGRQRSHLG